MKEEDAEPLFEGDLKSLQVLIEDQMMPDVLVLEEGGRTFIWEYQHERISLHPTQFRDIWPDYE